MHCLLHKIIHYAVTLDSHKDAIMFIKEFVIGNGICIQLYEHLYYK